MKNKTNLKKIKVCFKTYFLDLFIAILMPHNCDITDCLGVNVSVMLFIDSKGTCKHLSSFLLIFHITTQVGDTFVCIK